MAGATDLLEDRIVNYLRGTAPPAIAGLYLMLFTTLPNENGSGGVEVTGGAYARQQINSIMPASAGAGSTSNADLVFPTATAAWGTVQGCGLADAVTGGNILAFQALVTPRAVATTDVFKFLAGNLKIQAD